MKERIAFVDYIRVVACFLVMVVHSAENFYCVTFDETMVATSSNRFWVSLYDGFFGRVSVPLFMIVSAFLLVPMREGMTMTQFYKRRFMRILPPMVSFLLLYALLPLAW
jgi:peptidoglycan/LPS O-acetylase OafA/YrhL